MKYLHTRIKVKQQRNKIIIKVVTEILTAVHTRNNDTTTIYIRDLHSFYQDWFVFWTNFIKVLKHHDKNLKDQDPNETYFLKRNALN